MRILTTLVVVLLFGASASAQNLSYDEYIKKIDQQIRLNDTRNLPRTVKSNPVHTVGHFQGLVQSDLRRGNTDNAQMRQLLKDAWQSAFKGRTLEELEQWLERFNGDQRTMKAYTRAKNALNQTYGELNRLKSQKVEDRKPWDALRATLQQVCEQLGAVGHQIDTAEAWGVLAQVHASMPERTLDDRRASVEATREFLSHREAWDYTGDSYYQGNKSFAKGEEEAIKAAADEADKREDEGYAGDIKGVDAFLMPNSDTLQKTAKLEFAPLRKPKADFSLRGNSLGPEWFGVTVTKSGPEQLGWFSRREMFLVRPSGNEFGITRDGTEPDLEKNPFEEIEATNRMKAPSIFHMGKDETFPYAMWFWVGGQSEPFQGLSHNLAPQPDRATVYYRSASSWSVDLDGTKITFYDDNSNGELFEEDPYKVPLKDRNIGPDISEEVKVPTFDSMRIGRGALQPLSAWVQIGAAWYHMRGLNQGEEVAIRPANPDYLKTGSVQLDFEAPKSAKPLFVVIHGEGDFAAAAFDIGDGKAHEVPVGKYHLAFGRIESGKGARLMTANIFPGTMEAFEVKEGETTSVELGGPFQVDFAKEEADGKVSIDATTLRVTGRGGEYYTHLSGAPVEAEVLLSKSDSGRGGRGVGEFQRMPDAEVLNRMATKYNTLSSHVGYYPMPKGAKEDSFTLTFEAPAGQFVGLQQKKHKLFGKLMPIWK